MQRYKIKIEYEGTSFVGWQFQKNGQSVQEVLQKAIFNFSKENVTVTGAGRTDSGVHALAQVAHFDLKKKIQKKNLLSAINQNISNKSVTVLKINRVNKNFHARQALKLHLLFLTRHVFQLLLYRDDAFCIPIFCRGIKLCLQLL